MTAALIAQSLVIATLVAAFVIRERDHDKAISKLDERHADERRELATRIQHPQLVPTRGKAPRPTDAGHPKDLPAYAGVGRVRPPMTGPRPDNNGNGAS